MIKDTTYTLKRQPRNERQKRNNNSSKKKHPNDPFTEAKKTTTTTPMNLGKRPFFGYSNPLFPSQGGRAMTPASLNSILLVVALNRPVCTASS